MKSGENQDHQQGPFGPRNDGRYEVKLRLPDGTRRSFYGKTPQEAARKRRQAERQLAQGQALPPERLTVGQLVERWLEDVVRPTKAPRTYASYHQYARLYVLPALGRHRVAKLTALDVQRLLNAMAARGLSRRTIEYTRAVLRAAFNQGRRWGIVGQNPATLVVLPAHDEEPAETPALSDADAQAVLSAVTGDRLANLYAVALFLGLRPAEALGLRWEDVDLDHRVVRIRRTLQRIDGAWHLRQTKTKKQRTIPLPDPALPAFQRQRQQQRLDRLAAGPRWSGNAWGLVFTSSVGTPLDGSNVTHRFQKLLAAGDLPRLRFYDLRHAFASLMLAEGVHMRIVMEIMGHSTIVHTMNTYSHVAPAVGREAMDSLGRLFAEATDAPNPPGRTAGDG